MPRETAADEASIHCEQCDEAVPISQSVARDDDSRICWMCYTDEVLGPDEDDDADDEWDDDDDDWDDDDWDL
jgi:hypothetical protein